MRDMVFISHANPEDNEVTRWLALQLARAGYAVWCDLTKLLGGENFWNDIQAALRERTTKFIFVLSRNSNTKLGSLNELELATKVARTQKLTDFILPVWIDDLSASEFDIRIGTIGAVRFQEGWARGLDQLLKKLEQDGVPKNAGFNPSAVSSWWRQHVSAGLGLKNEPETLFTNWYPIGPAALHFHELGRTSVGPIEVASNLPYPAVVNKQYLVSFAPATAFDGLLGPSIFIRSSATRTICAPDPSEDSRLWTFAEERQGIANLLRQAWVALVERRKLPKYEFANGGLAFYFTKDMLPDDRAWFSDSSGCRSWRAVVGYKTLKKLEQGTEILRYWHFALQAKPSTSPFIGYTMKPHVLFSDDGQAIWESKRRLHRARRSQCRGWWNDRWRDLLFGATASLADEDGVIGFPVGPEETLSISCHPLALTSPVSYVEPGEAVEDELLFNDEEELDEDEIREDAVDTGAELGLDSSTQGVQ